MLRFFVFCFLITQFLHAQQVTFDTYKKRGDDCFKTQDYQCAKENYERALRIRNEEPYCKSQLQKTLKAIAKKNNGPVTPNPTPLSQAAAKPKNGGFVLIKGGTFQMGDDNGAVDERPAHSVTLKDFYVARQEVTVAQFQEFCKVSGKAMPTAPNWGWQDSHPVVGVSWNDAVAYCEWLSQKEGKKYRLLTEAEWEYAACGGAAKATVATESTGWYAGNTDGAGTKPVGTKKANAFGLYDMGGNAAEWCADWYGKDYYAGSPSANPPGAAQGSRRVVRGRSFGDEPKPLTFRYSLPPAAQNGVVGFRIGYDR
ncbi:MAG: formylglycine-generating enzyme family protein [Spirosomataceae bacterium]